MKAAKSAQTKARKTSFSQPTNNIQARAAAACGLPLGRFRQAAAACQKLNRFADEGDMISELWLQMEKKKGVPASVLIAHKVVTTRQKGSKSILCDISLNSSLDQEGDDRTIDLVAPDPQDLAESRQSEVLGLNIDNLRRRIMSERNCGDRRARQIIAAAAKRIEQDGVGFFGFDIGMPGEIDPSAIDLVAPVPKKVKTRAKKGIDTNQSGFDFGVK